MITAYSRGDDSGATDMTTKTNRENADAAQAAATEATLENVRVREQRSADAYAALAVRDERMAAKLAANKAGPDKQQTDTIDEKLSSTFDACLRGKAAEGWAGFSYPDIDTLTGPGEVWVRDRDPQGMWRAIPRNGNDRDVVSG